MAAEISCTRCRHERGRHEPKGGCRAAREDGGICRCPAFADPYKPVVPPQGRRPLGKEKGFAK